MYLLAPHPDDELLGAFSKLRPGLTVVLPQLDSARLAGSLALADGLGHRVTTLPGGWDWREPNGWWWLVNLVRSCSGALWHLPSPLDANPDHRQASALAYFCTNVVFYSVLPVGWTPPGRVCLRLGEFVQKQVLFKVHFSGEAEKYMPLLEEVGPYEYFFSPEEVSQCCKPKGRLPFYS